MQPVSPPKAEVDDSPLHQAMHKNKESLKVKLMMRRPINQLVAQGIMPPLKTPPGFHEQRQKLERAKMGDLLKAKIQQRPDREELVRQHILEDVGHVDPSLAERQRMLKKCKLADALNDQLSHRPGPLELIKKNILHTEEPIERAIKEGQIEFKATSEGQSTKPTHPDHYMLDEDSSSLSPPREDTPSVPMQLVATTTQTAQHVVGGAAGSGGQQQSPGIVTLLLTPTTAIALPNNTTIYSSAAATAAVPSTAVSSPRPTPSPSTTSSSSSSSSSASSSSLSKDKNRKKSKTKTQPKARTIKFHEYKGPPNAQKNALLNASPVETSYELLLQQQQLFLQWQLEWQHKYPQILLPASQKPQEPPVQASSSSVGSPAPPPPPLPQSPPPQPPLRNLEDMKVSDLKAELKRRNLPVSGAKPQLIERLKPFSESAASTNSIGPDDSLPSVCSVSSNQTLGGGELLDSPIGSMPPSPPPPSQQGLIGGQACAQRLDIAQPMDSEPSSHEGIIREQQRKIDQLQRQLINSQLQLQQQNSTFQPQSMSIAKASLAAFLQQQQLNQALLQQQQMNEAQVIANNNNNINTTKPHQRSNTLILEQEEKDARQHHRTGSLPNFIGTFVNGGTELAQTDQSPFTDNKNLFDTKPPIEIKVEPEEVKSQIVDDVLEILIKNGELPASAAAEPVELSQLEDMDVDSDLMEVDPEWFDKLISGGSSPHHTGDPLLAAPPSPSCGFDFFMDDADFKIHTGDFSWDRVDFAT